ncbi:class I adenylate-forming enzyme family protein [Thiolapillus sp.]
MLLRLAMAAEKHLALHPAFSICHRGSLFTAERLDGILNALCQHLQSMGLTPGGVVASTTGSPWLNALLLFALPRMGCVFLPLDPALPVSARRQLLMAARPDLLLLEEVFPGLPDTEYGIPCPQDPLPPDAAHLLLATSGTQGMPQVVELSGKNLLGSIQASCQRLKLEQDDAWLACLPLHHIGGLSVLLRCAYTGARVVLARRFEPGAVLDTLVSEGITHISLVPTMLDRLLKADPSFRPPASLRVVLLGGAAADAPLVESALQQGWPVCPSYGLTETASQVATLCPMPQHWQQGCVGRPLHHVQISICEQTGAIRVRGASVASHVRREDGSRIALTDAQGWLTTGDAGWLDAQGQLHVTGRLDDVLTTGGESLHPQLLEQELKRCHGVDELAVSAIRDNVWGDALAVLYCGTANPDQVRDWAKQHLQGAFVPKHYLRTASLPRNTMGKLLRNEVARRVQALIQED